MCGGVAARGRTKAARLERREEMQWEEDVVKMIRWSDDQRRMRGLQPDSPSRLEVAVLSCCVVEDGGRRRSRFCALHSFKARVVDRVGTRAARNLARHCTPPIKQTASVPGRCVAPPCTCQPLASSAHTASNRRSSPLPAVVGMRLIH